MEIKNIKTFNVFVGLGAGFIITSIYTAFFIDSMTNIQVYQEYLLWGVFSALMGLYQSIYQTEKLSLLARSFTHLFLSVLSYLTTMYLMNKYILDSEMDIASLLFVGLTFILIYFVIWLIMYKVEKKKIESLNKKLK